MPRRESPRTRARTSLDGSASIPVLCSQAEITTPRSRREPPLRNQNRRQQVEAPARRTSRSWRLERSPERNARVLEHRSFPLAKIESAIALFNEQRQRFTEEAASIQRRFDAEN